jgi:hypothetical protein
MFFSKKNSVTQKSQQQTNSIDENTKKALEQHQTKSIDENTKKALEQHQITFFRDYIRKGKKGSLSSVKFRVKIDLDGVAEIDGSQFPESIHICMWDNFYEVVGNAVNEFNNHFMFGSHYPHIKRVDILEIYHVECAEMDLYSLLSFDNFSMQDCHLHRFHRQYVVPAALIR